MTNEAKAAAQLAQSDVALLRSVAMILHVLVQKAIMPNASARVILKEARDSLPNDHPGRAAYDEVLLDFG